MNKREGKIRIKYVASCMIWTGNSVDQIGEGGGQKLVEADWTKNGCEERESDW